MAPAAWFGHAIEGQFSSTGARRVDWGTVTGGDSILVSLHAPAYALDPAAHIFFSDTTNELSGSGYTRQALAGKSVSYDSATKITHLIATTNTVFSLSGSLTFRWAVIWKNTGTNSTSPLLGFVDFGSQTASGTVTIDWDDVEGVLRGTVV